MARKTRLKHKLLTILVLAALIVGIASACTPVSDSGGTYIEPALLSHDTAEISVLVTSSNSESARQAVERAGGKVTSELWLIDAVAATIPTDQLQALAAQGGVVSIVDNKSVQTADQPEWVTERRVRKGTHGLDGTQIAPVASLMDGGILSVTESGSVLIVNDDGSERAQVAMDGGPFETAPVVGSDGMVYVAGEAHRVFALRPDGTVRWVFSEGGTSKFLGGVTLGLNGLVYVADQNRTLYALDPADGQIVWQFYAAQATGSFVTKPVAGSPPVECC